MARSEKSINRLMERADALREKGKTQVLDSTKLVPGQGLAGSLSDFVLPELLSFQPEGSVSANLITPEKGAWLTLPTVKE